MSNIRQTHFICNFNTIYSENTGKKDKQQNDVKQVNKIFIKNNKSY